MARLEPIGEPAAGFQPVFYVNEWPDDDDMNWLAGWIEGEGNFSPTQEMKLKSGNVRYPRISVSSTDRDVVEEAARIMSTEAKGPYFYKGKHGQPLEALWRINLHGRTAYEFMKRLLPYMRGERRIAKMLEQIAVHKSKYDRS